jgi:hypothetical protein
MILVKAMAFLQRGLRREPRIEQAIRNIEKPGAKRQRNGQPCIEPQSYRAAERPTPQGGNSGCVQTPQVPTPEQSMRKAQQTSV